MPRFGAFDRIFTFGDPPDYEPPPERAVSAKTPLVIRAPHATRPWQHVLECLNGYLMLAERLLATRGDMA